MSQKIDELSRTLLQSGIAASESEARRMAEDMVGTEHKVQTDFDNKRESVTMYGQAPDRTKKNPTDGSPVKEEPMAKPEVREESSAKAPNPETAVPTMTPEEYAAKNLGVEPKSTAELIQEEKLDQSHNKPVEEQKPAESESVAPQEEPVQQPKVDVPAPDAEDKAAMLEEMKHEQSEEKTLPNLNPLKEESNHAQPSETPKAEPESTEQKTPETETPKAEPESTEQKTPETNTPKRPELTPERKKEIEDMEESKVDLSKVFKV